ncbi:MAG: hypothetical protein HQL48_11650, partial [Gammaproteobacteria bacterium]|nr:hypothetical protein [Gammaproteobacteria bacterium]
MGGDAGGEQVRTPGIQSTILLIVLFPLALLFVSLARSSYEKLDALEASFHERGVLLVRQLAVIARYGVITGNLAADEREIEELRAVPGVLGLEIRDDSGKMLLLRGALTSVETAYIFQRMEARGERTFIDPQRSGSVNY